MNLPGNAPASDLPPAPRETTPRPPGRRFSVFMVCATVIAIAAIIAGLVAYLKFVDGVAGTVSKIAGRFHNETITETFISSALNIVSSRGATLELATAERTETFKRTSSKTLWDLLIPLGTTESEITVPATYRYHIDLDGDWSLSTRGQTCVVMAPMFKPSLPVAIDTGHMQKKTRSGWARFDKADNLEALEKNITGSLAERAAGPENLDAIREDCRRSVARFVMKWLLREDHWNDVRFNEIIVLFPDETAPGAGDALRPSRSFRL